MGEEETRVAPEVVESDVDRVVSSVQESVLAVNPGYNYVLRARTVVGSSPSSFKLHPSGPGSALTEIGTPKDSLIDVIYTRISSDSDKFEGHEVKATAWKDEEEGNYHFAMIGNIGTRKIGGEGLPGYAELVLSSQDAIGIIEDKMKDAESFGKFMHEVFDKTALGAMNNMRSAEAFPSSMDITSYIGVEDAKKILDDKKEQAKMMTDLTGRNYPSK